MKKGMIYYGVMIVFIMKALDVSSCSKDDEWREGAVIDIEKKFLI